MGSIREKFFVKPLAVVLTMGLFMASVGRGVSEAMVVPAGEVAQASAIDRASDMTTIQAALENKVIRQRLHDMGLSETQIDQRLGRLSDQQVHQVALQIEKQNPAGDGGTIALIAIGVVLFIVLIAAFLKNADDDDDKDKDNNTTINQTAPAPAAPAPAAPANSGPETIIVK